ncbi:MAG: rhodanese-like domain-containing protein [Thermodesulfobacteriota bacterium]
MAPCIWKRTPGPALLTLLSSALFLLLTVGQASGVPQGGYAPPEMLIQPEELKALLDRKAPNLRIIDVRHKAKYYLGHIPGALEVWRPDLENQKNRGLPASQTQMESLLGRLGVGGKDTLILYGDHYDHTRLWLLLAYYGFPLERLRLLDGGLEAWKAKGYPTQFTAPRVSRTRYKLPGPSPASTLLSSLEEVKKAISDPRKVILDVRSQRQYLGQESKEGATRHGHIPGALWLAWQENVVPAGPFKGYMKSEAEIKKIYGARGATPDKDIYLYSHNGLPATLGLVSLYLAGYPLEKLHLYLGSWVEWSRSQEAVEMGTNPAPVRPRPPDKAMKTESKEERGNP